MGGGGGGQDSQTFQSDFPPWMQKSHLRSVGEAEDLAYGTDYPLYVDDEGGDIPRIADWTEDQQLAFQRARDFADQGDPYADYAGAQLEDAAGLASQYRDIYSDYEKQDFDFGEFDQSQADKYMNPYQQNVTDIALRSERDEFQRQQMQTESQRVASGSFGGTRGYLNDLYAESMSRQNLSDIQAEGSLAAYGSAQAQFELDRKAAIEAARMGDDSAFNAAKMRMDASIAQNLSLDEQNKGYLGRAETANLTGDAGQSRFIERNRELERVGLSEQSMQQAGLDLAHEDFTRQNEWGWTQLSRLAGIQKGVPLGLQSTTSSPGPSTLSTLLGLGVGAAGVKQLFDN